MPARVRDLRPGQIVDLGLADSATLIGWSVPHPRYPNLALVVWRVHDNPDAPPAFRDARYSFDALSPDQVVGEVRPQTEAERLDELERSVEGGGPG